MIVQLSGVVEYGYWGLFLQVNLISRQPELLIAYLTNDSNGVRTMQDGGRHWLTITVLALTRTSASCCSVRAL